MDTHQWDPIILHSHYVGHEFKIVADQLTKTNINILIDMKGKDCWYNLQKKVIQNAPAFSLAWLLCEYFLEKFSKIFFASQALLHNQL